MELVKKLYIYIGVIVILTMILMVISPQIMIHGVKLSVGIMFGGSYIYLRKIRGKIKEYCYNHYDGDETSARLAYKWNIFLSYVMLIVGVAFVIKFITELV